MQKQFYIIICALFIVFGNQACSNKFDYEANEWKLVTSTKDTNTKKIYIDENRTNCEAGVCQAWTKMVFATTEPISFDSQKEGSRKQVILVKRVDSTVKYDCRARTSTIISYQLYDKEDKLAYSNWPNKPLTQSIAKNSVDNDLLKYLCK